MSVELENGAQAALESLPDAAGGAAIEAAGLTRYYGTARGVRDLDLAVPAGAILGLLGENGSGLMN
jgi:ABC-type sugar transport system ATPase subunit